MARPVSIYRGLFVVESPLFELPMLYSKVPYQGVAWDRRLQ